MLCPKCKTEMRITNTSTIATGDDSPDTQTNVYFQQDLSCRAPECTNFKKVVHQAKTYFIGEE